MNTSKTRKNLKKIRTFFTIIVAIPMILIMIYSWIDVLKNPQFHQPIKLDYAKKQTELQQILDKITANLPEPNQRKDVKRLDAQRIGITYIYHNPTSSQIDQLLTQINHITNIELSAYNRDKHSFSKKFCFGENEITITDYHFDNVYQLYLNVDFYPTNDCRRLLFSGKP